MYYIIKLPTTGASYSSHLIVPLLSIGYRLYYSTVLYTVRRLLYI